MILLLNLDPCLDKSKFDWKVAINNYVLLTIK